MSTDVDVEPASSESQKSRLDNVAFEPSFIVVSEEGE